MPKLRIASSIEFTLGHRADHIALAVIELREVSNLVVGDEGFALDVFVPSPDMAVKAHPKHRSFMKGCGKKLFLRMGQAGVKGAGGGCHQ